ncbi:MAG: hypothetical protein O6926_07990 [candidate division NC10 bacterium]|nr:hypothetical protein [candidate division NC10 bacterium]
MKRGFGGVERSVKSLLTRMGGFRAAIGAVAGTAGLGLLFRNALKTADEIAKTSRAIGITTDALQEWRFAASQSGIATAEFDSALAGFSKRVGEARSGTGTLITLLKKLDPTLLKNVQAAKNVDEAFNLIVKSASEMGNQLDRNALLAAAFGRTAGIQMANLVEGGTRKIEALRQTARDLGLVLSEELLANAEKTTDELDKLGRVISANVNKALLEAAPLIAQVTVALTGMVAATAKGVIEWQKLNREIAKSGAIVGFEGIMGLDEPTLVPGGVDLGVSRPTPAIAAQTAATRELTAAEKLAAQTRQAALLELRKTQEEVNKRGQQLWLETRTEAERYTMQIQELNRLYREEGVISLDTYNRGLDRIRVAMDGVKQETELATLIGTAFTFQLASGLADAVTSAESFGDAMAQLAVQIGRMIIQMLVFRAITGAVGALFGGIGGGGATPVQLSGSFQSGGTVPGPIGKPRMFMLHGGEEIIPASERGLQRGPPVTIVQNFSPGLREAIRQEMQNFRPVMMRDAIRAIEQEIHRGGTLTRAVGRRK